MQHIRLWVMVTSVLLVQSGWNCLAAEESRVFSGDDMTLNLQFSEDGNTAHGSLTVADGTPLLVRLRTENGRIVGGKVQTPQGTKDLVAYADGASTTVVEYLGQRYRLRVEDAYSQRRQSADETHRKLMELMTAGDDDDDYVPPEPTPESEQRRQQMEETQRKIREMMEEATD